MIKKNKKIVVFNRLTIILCMSLLAGCGAIDKINKFNSKGYTFLINEKDTLVFEKIYLDNAYKHTFTVDKKNKVINYYIDSDSLTSLLGFKQIEDIYKDSAKQIAFIIFQTHLIGIDSKYYIQRSLLENPERIKDEVMATIRCYGRQGDVLIFN